MIAHEMHPASHPIFQLQHCIQLPTSLASHWGHREPEHPHRRSLSTHSWAWNQRAGEVTQSPCSSLAPQSPGNQGASTGTHIQHTTGWLLNIKSQKQAQLHIVFSGSSLMPQSHPAALEEGDQPCSAQTQQALYSGFIDLHWYNLAGAYSEGILIPEGTVFMEPGCFYGVMDLGLSFLSISHWARKALEYCSTHVCEAQLVWTQQEKKFLYNRHQLHQ